MPELEGMRSVTLVINRETSMEHTERLITALSHLSTTFLDDNRSQNQVVSGVIIPFAGFSPGAQSEGCLLREEEESGHWRKPRGDMWRAHLHDPTRCSGCEEQGSSRSSTLFHDSVQGVKLSDESHQDEPRSDEGSLGSTPLILKLVGVRAIVKIRVGVCVASPSTIPHSYFYTSGIRTMYVGV
ncbi:hypothetical protein GW17_00029105 [Ensete ventricosum]|nr:hypothetical protein GW17_00029105 [Ensete ventricosum]